MCAVESCEVDRIEGRGLCMKHYKRWRRHGDPSKVTYMRGRPIEERFWARVRKSDECWEWTGGRDEKGYGRLYENGARGKMRFAHHFSFELHVGPRGGMDVLHDCDHPWCVRPEHLHLGTHAQNMAEMVARGRSKNCGNWKEGRTQP